MSSRKLEAETTPGSGTESRSVYGPSGLSQL